MVNATQVWPTFSVFPPAPPTSIKRRCFRQERRSIPICLPLWRRHPEMRSLQHWSSVWPPSTPSSTLSSLFSSTCSSGSSCITATSASATRACFCSCACCGQRCGRLSSLSTLKMWCRPTSYSLWPTGCSIAVPSACSSSHSACSTSTSHRYVCFCVTRFHKNSWACSFPGISCLTTHCQKWA